MANTENHDTRTPMGENGLRRLLSYLKQSFLDGESDSDIVEDVFGVYGAWREDIIALIRLMVKEKKI